MARPRRKAGLGLAAYGGVPYGKAKIINGIQHLEDGGGTPISQGDNYGQQDEAPPGPNEQAFLDNLMTTVGGNKALYNQAVNKLYSGGGGSTYQGGEDGLPTQDQIDNVLGYTESHMKTGFGSGPLAGIGNFATSGPLGGILSAAAFVGGIGAGAEGLGGLSGIGAAASDAGEAGALGAAGSIDAANASFDAAASQIADAGVLGGGGSGISALNDAAKYGRQAYNAYNALSGSGGSSALPGSVGTSGALTAPSSALGGLAGLSLAGTLPAVATAQAAALNGTSSKPTPNAAKVAPFNPLDPSNLATTVIVNGQFIDPALSKEYSAMTPQGLAFGGTVTPHEPEVMHHMHAAFGRGSGLIHGATGGRADAIPTFLPRGGYVIPADVVSGLGQGNTAAGGVHFKTMIGTAHAGFPAAKFASGGVVPARVSAGEYFVHPRHVVAIGKGDIEHGHRILGHIVAAVRSKVAQHAVNAPPPAQ